MSARERSSGSARVAGSPKRSAAHAERWAWALVVVGPVLVFARALPYGFAKTWDDGRFIVDNPDVQHVSVGALVRMFTTVQFEAYHPLHLLSYWLDVPWFGPTPFAVHAVSLALWVFALTQMYLLLRALGVPAISAAIGTLACGVHPAQLEVVSWASGRKDVLALLFVASSLRLQLTAAGPWRARAWLGRALYVAALLSKTTALPLPLFALLLDVYALRKPWRSALLTQLPNFVLAGLASAAALWIWHDHTMLRTTLGGVELAPLRFAQTLGHQWSTALWPSRNSPMYAIENVAQFELTRMAAFGVYAAVCVWLLRAGRGLAFAGALGFAVWLVPASNLVPLYFPLQDRYLSLPLFALGIALAGDLAQSQRRSQLQVLGFAIVAALAARGVQYAGEWQSETRLWGHAVRTQPDATYAYLKLGEVRREAGDFEGAIHAYHGAIWLTPTRKLAHAGLFEVVARRDERIRHLSPPRARELAVQYFKWLDDPDALRPWVGELWARGYVRSAELPLQLVLGYQPLPDNALAQAALAALRADRPTLGQFYLHALKQPPDREPLAGVYAWPYLRVVP
ncbi:MAG: hypothetical protein RL701_7860 [Pseudomonadota bacterium]